ncbi:glycosyl hydrolase [Paramyrothecium foliicola]|nr:glycosyl hydrolase [Paramyrothecium foliicola]
MTFRLLCIVCASLNLVLAQPQATPYQRVCSVLKSEPKRDCLPFAGSFLNSTWQVSADAPADYGILEDLYEALAVLQGDYFDADYGTWPSAIDWTGAVVETIISGTLTSLSKSFGFLDTLASDKWKAKENLISFYFAQVVNSFFGQDILSIRGEAFDDILWVVLGWIEAIQFVNTHTDLHYPSTGTDGHVPSGGLKDALSSLRWHGHNWISAFAHRARIFWRLGAGGWDTKLCGGGMVWNRRLLPYKNAITNELWISASIAMYEHFPGDNFTAPWTVDAAFPERDPAHLVAAIEGYRWLQGVNMTNRQGLFVDGYHISDIKGGNRICDLRDEMVYTYNQGVVLTGLRGLWAFTGMPSYLQDGHELIQSVIKASGWSLEDDAPVDKESHQPNQLPRWHGLGRAGILEESCDASGTCSQDGQTFKGIFFHHLTAFCAMSNSILLKHDAAIVFDEARYREIEVAHQAACRSYLGWIRHNAQAALRTRDSGGRFGMWWGAAVSGAMLVSEDNDGIDHKAENTTDYRNDGTPRNEVWGKGDKWTPGSGNQASRDDRLHIQPAFGQWALRQGDVTKQTTGGMKPITQTTDPNDRGRGRTVETQAGGLAVLRAYWEISQARN